MKKPFVNLPLVKLTIVDNLLKVHSKTDPAPVVVGKPCPGCSGHGTPSSINFRVLVCDDCNGLYTSEPLTMKEARVFVNLRQMKDRADHPRYFDFVIYNPQTGTNDRTHGWFDSRDGVVVQFG